MSQTTMRALRAELAEIAIDLRAAKDQLQAAQLDAEQRTIDAAGSAKSLGANEDERRRKLAQAVHADRACAEHLAKVRVLEARKDRLDAELASETDERRAHEWSVRDRLVELLSNTLSTHPGPRVPKEQLALDDEMTDTSIGQACRVVLPSAPATPSPRTDVPSGRPALALVKPSDNGDTADGRHPQPMPPRDDDYAADELAEELSRSAGPVTAPHPDDLPF